MLRLWYEDYAALKPWYSVYCLSVDNSAPIFGMSFLSFRLIVCYSTSFDFGAVWYGLVKVLVVLMVLVKRDFRTVKDKKISYLQLN